MADDSLIGRLRGTLARELPLLLVLWLISFAFVAAMALRVHEPTRYIDEFLFWALAKNFAAGDGFSWRGRPVPVVAILYPLLISGIFRLATGVQQQYELVRVLGAGLVTAAVFPAYLAARLRAPRGLSLLAALLCVLAGAVCYAGLVATETLAYPLASAALFALVYALLHPRWGTAAIFTSFFLLAAATRIQLTALYAVALLALVLLIALGGAGGRRSLLARHRPLALILAAIGALALAYLALRGRAALGIYGGGLIEAEFDAGDLHHWLRAYGGEVFLLGGIVPAIATFALAFDPERRRDPAVLALLLVTFAAAAVLVLQLSLFSASNTEFWRERNVLYERYMIYLGPLLFVGFVWSLGRVRVRAVAISTAIAASALAIFPLAAVKQPFSLDAFGQTYLAYLLDSSPGLAGHLGSMLVLVCLAGGGLLMLASRKEDGSLSRIATVLAVVAPIYLLSITQLKAWEYQEVFSASVQASYAQPVNWVERTGTRPVAILVGAGSEPVESYGVEFRNPVVSRVYVSEVAPVASPPIHAPVCEFYVGARGKLLGTEAMACESVPHSWLTIGKTFAMRLRGGEQLAPPDADPATRLQTSDGPPRVLAMVGGRDRSSGAIGEQLVVRSYLDRPGELRVRASSGKTYKRQLASGERLTQITIGELGFGRDPKSEPIEIRERGGPWRAIE